MTRLSDYISYADAQQYCTPEKLWEMFDGSRERMNIAHECIDRHVDGDRAAVILVRADGGDELISFRDISVDSSRFAHYLVERGVVPGDRVAVMLEPSREFYVAIFGAMKMGAVAVPLFTLFGPDGIRLRVRDCRPRILVTNAEKAPLVNAVDGLEVIVADGEFLGHLSGYPDRYECRTSGDDLAMFQYTSGTTREVPEAVRHRHRAIVTVMLAALYGTGVRPGERFMCPSSPAWGHGLWHGTLAPLAMGATIGAYAGKFRPERLLQALETHRFGNISAAATHYRMMRTCGAAGNHRYALRKLSYTGEPIDSETAGFIETVFGLPACSMYGTTEVGVCLVNYPGAPDFKVKPGSLGKPVPGLRVEVHDPEGRPCPPGRIGEIRLLRRGEWIRTRDLGRVDEDGYLWHAGRADDVIISAGWTIGAVEVEDAVLGHPDVREAAVIGVPDPLRGQVVKAFVVSDRPGSERFAEEIQNLVRERLSQHEYPRRVEFVPELPKTPAGKINRRQLRLDEQARNGSAHST